MKRIACVALLLTAMAATARAFALSAYAVEEYNEMAETEHAFDLSAYVVEDADEMLPVSDGRVLLLDSRFEPEEEGDAELYDATMVRDGQVIAQARFGRDSGWYRPFALADGRSGFLVGDIGTGEKTAFCYWGASSVTPRPIALSAAMQSAQACGDGLMGVEKKDGEYALVLLNDMGRVRNRIPLGSQEGSSLAACAQGADGTYLALIAGSQPSVWRIAPDGNPIWRMPVTFEVGRLIVDDGEGGVFALCADRENYKITQVHHVAADGTETFLGFLAAKDLIYHADVCEYDAASGWLIVTGRAISKSRGVYDVVQLAMTRDGRIEWTRAWDFSARPDYGFDVHRAQDGTLYAFSASGYLDTTGTNAVLVPVEELPEGICPVMTLTQSR